MSVETDSKLEKIETKIKKCIQALVGPVPTHPFLDKISKANCQFADFAHALIALQKHLESGKTLCSSIRSNKFTASSYFPAFPQAAIAAA